VTSQLRTYDIKLGEMEGWLKLFREKVVPLHRKYDIPVRAAWVDRERSQFIWVRELVGTGTPEQQEERYRNSEERTRIIGDEPSRFIENMDVRVVEQVFVLETPLPKGAGDAAPG
jgi:hypothetical protein